MQLTQERKGWAATELQIIPCLDILKIPTYCNLNIPPPSQRHLTAWPKTYRQVQSDSIRIFYIQQLKSKTQRHE